MIPLTLTQLFCISIGSAATGALIVWRGCAPIKGD
jgi:hypothetical protein